MLQRTFNLPDTALGRARPKLDLRLTTLAELGLEAYAEQPDKLERARTGFRREGPLSFLRGRPRQDGLESGSPLTTQVFLTVAEKGTFDRLASDFAGRDLVIQSRAETVGTAHLPLSLLKELEARADVLAIEWSGAFRPQAGSEDDSAPPGLAPRVVMGLENAPSHVDGTGTLVGVVDCGGLDLYHPSFVDEHGRSRVRALWDQRAARATFAPAGAVPQPAYGRAHDRASLDEELSDRQPKRYSVVAHQASKGSHGTATASIAAGLGGDRAAARGVAPGAEIVFVDTFGSGAGALGALTELADAIGFVFDVADAAGKPCAVNVSLGDDLGPRDGTSPVERFIEQRAKGPGRAVIVAAGNSGESRRHAAADLTAAPSATFDIDVGRKNWRSAVIEIWYAAEAGSGAALDVEIEAPGTGERTHRILPDGLPRAFDTGGTRVLVASTDRVPVGENGLVRIELLPTGDEPLVSGTWKVHVFPRGGVRAARASIDHPYIKVTRATAAIPASTITSPATSRAAITVGAFDLERRQACWYSGGGPRGQGPRKPELLAAGGPMIAASASTPPRYVDTACGTSAAAPLVAGAVAVLFQQFGPGLGRDELIGMLTPPAHDHDKAGPPVASLAHVAWPGARPAADSAADPFEDAGPAPPREGRSAGSSSAPVPPRAALDVAQIWAGSYVLHQGGKRVGRLLVTKGEAEAESVEHWLLDPTFVAPSAGRRVTKLKIRYSGAPEPEKDFLARSGRGRTYIRARCTTRVTDGYATDADVDGPVSGDRNQQQERDSTVAERNYVKPADAVQIWAGEYILRQAGEIVGKLHVEELTGPADTKEHWLLYRAYRWPSSTYPNQELAFHYQNSPGRLSDFLANAPEGSIYVIARCEQGTLP